MAAEVGPSREVGVVVLAAGLEEVGMVAHQHGGDPGSAQMVGERVLPGLDRTPGPPEEVQRTAEDVVARRHAGDRAGEVALEAQGAPSHAVQVRGGELRPPVGAEEVAVQAVQEDHHHIGGHRRLGGRRGKAALGRSCAAHRGRPRVPGTRFPEDSPAETR